MAHAIGYGKIGGLQGEIVPADLRESGFGYGDERRFALDKKKRSTFFGQDHNIGPLGQCVITHTGFNGKKRLWVAVMVNQQMNKMLANPFLRR